MIFPILNIKQGLGLLCGLYYSLKYLILVSRVLLSVADLSQLQGFNEEQTSVA